MKPTDPRFNRRAFPGETAALGAPAASPTIIPARAFGATERIRTGHIGVKNQGTNNLKGLRKNVVAVCDIDKDMLIEAKELAENKGARDLATCSDYRAFARRQRRLARSSSPRPTTGTP